MILTNSRVACFRACPRKHHYAYTLGRRPHQSTAALASGTALHAGCEVYWRARQDEVPPEARATLAADAFEERIGELDQFAVARLGVLLQAYCAAWDTRAIRRVLEVEKSFRLDLWSPNGHTRHPLWSLGGKIDAIAELGDGRIAIVEHKSTSTDSSEGSSYRDRLAMDSQISTYISGASALGYEADVCLYDVLVKPSVRPFVATPTEKRRYTKAGKLYADQREADETVDEYKSRVLGAVTAQPERYLQVFEVSRPDRELREAHRDLWQCAKEITALEQGEYPRRNPDACHRYGACEYLGVCRGEARIDDDSLFRSTGPTPELSSEEESDR